ncbi:hypothetical protein CFE70_001756 [Pyrenophora teres f. teres 0-1]
MSDHKTQTGPSNVTLKMYVPVELHPRSSIRDEAIEKGPSAKGWVAVDVRAGSRAWLAYPHNKRQNAKSAGHVSAAMGASTLAAAQRASLGALGAVDAAS